MLYLGLSPKHDIACAGHIGFERAFYGDHLGAVGLVGYVVGYRPAASSI